MDIPVSIEEVSPDVWIKYEEHYKTLLNESEMRRKLPLLNANALHHLQDNRLVRFIGMIQDMHTPEFYFESFEIINKETKASRLSTGKYRDTADISEKEVLDYHSPTLRSAERQTMITITLPGYNEWAQKIEQEMHHKPHLSQTPGTSENSSNLKRSHESAVTEPMELGEDTNETSKEVKKMSNDLENGTSADDSNGKDVPIVSHDHIMNLPLPDSVGKVCMMKVYNDFNKFKLNDMIEVLGFLSVDPALGNEWSGQKDNVTGEDADAETLTHHPPPSLVPRIHAVRVETLSHCNPLLHHETDLEVCRRDAKEARDHLHLALTQILFGDVLAADYLICYLISRVYIRQDVLSIGKFALNISNIPCVKHPNYAKQLYNVLKQLVTKSYYLPLTLDNMNTLAFAPKKDYTCNRLTSGILQLSKNTHLVLDETKMESGQLNSAGLGNLSSLKEVIETQKLKYDFKFYQMDFDCDIPVLVLSEGKSLLPSDFHVKLEIDGNNESIVNEIFEAAGHYLNKDDILNKIRMFLTSMQTAEYKIETEPEYIQEDFISMRRVVNGQEQKATAEDLHNLLVLTRLIGLSHGHDKLTKDCWELAKSMEEQRLARLTQ